MRFVRKKEDRAACVGEVSAETMQDRMDEMAAHDLNRSRILIRQSALSSLCNLLVHGGALPANPVAKFDRHPHLKEPLRQVPGPEIMDRLVKAARDRRRSRDLVFFFKQKTAYEMPK